jgi:hypothetical protein
MPRKLSPSPGFSILITSAPKSAKYLAQFGPAKTVERSITRRSCSGAGILDFD